MPGAPTGQRKRRGFGSAWDLPSLIRPLPVRQRKRPKQPRLLPHFPAIVEFVYNHRWVTGEQVQWRFPKRLASSKTKDNHLASLVQLGFLALAPVRSTSPNFPYVYCATTKGIRLVGRTLRVDDPTWTGSATERVKAQGMALESVLHELLLTEISVVAQRTLRHRREHEVVMHERRYYRKERRLEFVSHGQTWSVEPDIGLLVRYLAEGGQRLLLHFVELDNGTASAAAIRAKYRLYEAWSHAAEGERYMRDLFARFGVSSQKPTWRLLMVAHDKDKEDGDLRRLLDLLAQTLELPTALRERVWLTTGKALHAAGELSAPLTAKLWVRARDVRGWMGEYRRYMAELPKNKRQRPYKAQREFVNARLESLPLHALFPRVTSHQAA